MELKSRTPALSLILCSCNDQYMGNSRWRLQTSLNYVAKNIHELGRNEDIEIMVSDWGSEIPLREVLELSQAASGITSFVHVPHKIATEVQKDSPFSDALALNAVARRARGDYIGRIDQDTLVGKRFLKYFFDLYEGRQKLEIPMGSALFFANQRMVPYRLCVQCPPLEVMEKYVGLFGGSFKIEITPLRPFYAHGVGIWLLHRDLWNLCGGYDERMIYMNDTEVNMIARLRMNDCEVVNLGEFVGHDFYHIEHYHPLAIRSSSTHRKVNPKFPFAHPETLNPNGPDWGFIKYHFDELPYPQDRVEVQTPILRQMPFDWPSFIITIVGSGIQIITDRMVITYRKITGVWRYRVSVIWETVHGQPLVLWPRLLINLLKSKRHKNELS